MPLIRRSHDRPQVRRAKPSLADQEEIYALVAHANSNWQATKTSQTPPNNNGTRKNATTEKTTTSIPTATSTSTTTSANKTDENELQASATATTETNDDKNHFIEFDVAGIEQLVHHTLKDRMNHELAQAHATTKLEPCILSPLFDDDDAGNNIMKVDSQWCLISVLADTDATKHVNPNDIFGTEYKETGM